MNHTQTEGMAENKKPVSSEKKPDSLDRLIKYASSKCKKPKPFTISIVIAIIAILAGLFYTKEFFIAAVVDGKLITRWSVMVELEKQGGKQALDTVITKRLIDSEAKKNNVIVAKEDIDVEVKKVEEQLISQGETLQGALFAQGMTEEGFREQIAIQKKVEKLLADKIAVSDEDIDTYIKDSKAVTPKDVTEEDFRKQVSDQLQQQKLQQEADVWIADLKSKSTIKYYANYSIGE